MKAISIRLYSPGEKKSYIKTTLLSNKIKVYFLLVVSTILTAIASAQTTDQVKIIGGMAGYKQ